MDPVNRKVTYRLYPSSKQEAVMLETLRLHQRLYNVALEQRRSAWQRVQKGVGFADQCRQLTELRAAFPEYAALNAQSCQVTLKRLDLAFAAFFRRVKCGDEPGYPRFKALDRFSGWGYKTHGDGWTLLPGKAMQHGQIRLSGIGKVRMRGKARTEGEPVTCEIMRKNGKWYASVTVECSPVRQCGDRAAGFDWGVETFATVAYDDGAVEMMENPRHLKRSADVLAVAQQALSRKQGPPMRRVPSNRWRKAKARVSRIQEKIACQRRDFLHQTSARIISDVALLAGEELAIKNMTASARGTIEEPGRNVAQKAGLNRSILDTAPAMWHSMLSYKAEEAGAMYLESPTRELKPTQRCHACWNVERKSLSDRVHHGSNCGTVCGRDENSSKVNLRWAIAHTGWEPARHLETAPAVSGCETPAIARSL